MNLRLRHRLTIAAGCVICSQIISAGSGIQRTNYQDTNEPPFTLSVSENWSVSGGLCRLGCL